MCLTSSAPKQEIVDPTNRQAMAAADAAQMARRTAQGYSANLLGGMNTTVQPTLARQFLLGNG